MPVTVTGYTPDIEPGTYQAVLTDLTTRESKDGGEYRHWEFALTDGSARSVGANSSMYLSPKSKGGKWLTAIMGRALVEGENIEPVGRPCTISVILNDNGFPTVEAVMGPIGKGPQSPVKPLETGAEKAERIHAEQEGDALPF